MNNQKAEAFAEEMADFISVKMEKSSIDGAVDWIKDNLNPDDVFTDDQLRECVGKMSLPGDVFSEKELSDWAESNGYTKE